MRDGRQGLARALEEVRPCPRPAASPFQVPEDLRLLPQLGISGYEQSWGRRSGVLVVARGHDTQALPDQVRRRQPVLPRTGERLGVLAVEANGGGELARHTLAIHLRDELCTART